MRRADVLNRSQFLALEPFTEPDNLQFFIYKQAVYENGGSSIGSRVVAAYQYDTDLNQWAVWKNTITEGVMGTLDSAIGLNQAAVETWFATLPPQGWFIRVTEAELNAFLETIGV